ncbi:dimethylallyltransferase [Cytophagales bacterium WSM2-2]|nr:dimethylallyltransferase [Cytophagales bacterium WSM2-2]
MIVATNVDSVGNNISGSFLMEIAYPFQYFVDNGFDVDIVTPKGGKVAIYDNGKVKDDLKKIRESKLFTSKTATSLSPGNVDTKNYAAIFYPGGHGQYFDVINDERISAIAARIYENGGALGTAGHGAASLINIQLSGGKYLVDGKKITCFPHWAEKKFMNISNYGKLLPFDMQEVLARRGANLIVCTEATRPNTEFTHVEDTKARIVTGAFATSAPWVAERMVILLRTRGTN